MRKNFLFVFAFVALSGCGDNASTQDSEASSAKVKASADTATSKAAKAELPAEILWESDLKRYDHAPTILVLTDSNSHKRMHGLVDQFARKISSKKFSLIVMDNKGAGLVYKASHYGANESNRIATKEERKLMDKHIVGTYTGELEANGTPYEIAYHGFGFEKESHEEYEPQL